MTWDEEPHGEDPFDRLRESVGRVFDSIRRNPAAWATGVLTTGALVAGVAAGKRKRIFVSFAIEDSFLREALRGQSLNTRTPFEFRDMGLDEPFSERWKTQCRAVIRQCNGMIALITSNVISADGARWEMACAVEEGIPILGVRPKSEATATVPPEMRGASVIDWTWQGIADWIDSL